ncbi:hypothetical protein GCM10009775_11900 [Microbacterium aoyamense]|uniref:Uncharacterized protein n=1 Tax=Microbacterium aoyamense TaxID=344166 RepID=A0ABP5ARU6_9MICO|nr:hypothetical protein [Microbacterium aoyamense]
METFAQLWEGYWWLIFPVGAITIGLISKIGNAWERAAKRRHKQRIELLHARSELTAAKRGTAVAKTSAGAVEHETESQATQLARLFATHDSVTARWLDYELDVAKLIAFPAMSDGRQPLTAAFLRAQRIADGLRPASPKARLTPAQLAEYRNAVADYEVAFDVAERDARRIKDTSFTDTERKRLDKAKQLLAVAVDQAATPAERQIAYRRVREELDGLIALSDDAIEVLETKVALEIASPVAPTTSLPATSMPASPPAPGAREHAPWPVPARSSETAPGRVIHPKPQG